MTKQYFYSPDLDECPGCCKRKNTMRGVGIVELTAVGRPLMCYALCPDCAPKMLKENIQFVRDVKQRVMARAFELGAFGPVGGTA